jgi:hypothetical protein
MSFMRRSALIALIVLTTSSVLPGQSPATRDKPTRVLFIGNSYTNFNGSIPKILEEMASDGGVAFEAEASLMGGTSLEWHFTDGKARAAIAKGGWDFVVLQDHSRQAIDHPEKLAEYAKQFAAEIEKVGAEPVFYMTWARQNEPEKQAVITKAYQAAASATGGQVAPVGLAWQRVLKQRQDIPLHFEDKSHPTPAGSYLAACVFYRVLLDQPPPQRAPAIFNQRTKEPTELAADTAEFLRKIAAEVTADVPVGSR